MKETRIGNISRAKERLRHIEVIRTTVARRIRDETLDAVAVPVQSILRALRSEEEQLINVIRREREILFGESQEDLRKELL